MFALEPTGNSSATSTLPRPWVPDVILVEPARTLLLPKIVLLKFPSFTERLPTSAKRLPNRMRFSQVTKSRFCRSRKSYAKTRRAFCVPYAFAGNPCSTPFCAPTVPLSTFDFQPWTRDNSFRIRTCEKYRGEGYIVTLRKASPRHHGNIRQPASTTIPYPQNRPPLRFALRSRTRAAASAAFDPRSSALNYQLAYLPQNEL